MAIEKNVTTHLVAMGEKVGNFKSDEFQREIENNFKDYKIDSPIEQILYCAIKSMSIINGLNDTESREHNGNLYVEGVLIYPQYEIGKYRADFKVEYVRKNSKRIGEQIEYSVIVECDSQQFHDRDETQRRYEKKRDRDIQTLGYKVFRFTGTEIIKEPYRVAAEILSQVVHIPVEDFISSMENF